MSPMVTPPVEKQLRCLHSPLVAGLGRAERHGLYGLEYGSGLNALRAI